MLIAEYQMNHLKKPIENHLLQQDLSLERLVLADRCDLTDLRKACLEHAKKQKLCEQWMTDYKSASNQLEPPHIFRSQHCSTWQKVYHEQQESEKQEDINFSKPWDHSDVTFIVEGQKVYANKKILSMSSPVMKAMFESDFREKDAKEIELPGKELDNFLDLVKIAHPPNQFKGNVSYFSSFMICPGKTIIIEIFFSFHRANNVPLAEKKLCNWQLILNQNGIDEHMWP